MFWQRPRRRESELPELLGGDDLGHGDVRWASASFFDASWPGLFVATGLVLLVRLFSVSDAQASAPMQRNMWSEEYLDEAFDFKVIEDGFGSCFC